MPDLRMNGEDLPPYITPELHRILRVLTDEVHACREDVGKLMGEVGRLSGQVRDAQGAAFRTLEQVNKIGERLARMRTKLESVPDAEDMHEAAEDTAQTEIAKLRAEIQAKELAEAHAALESKRASERVRAKRKWEIIVLVAANLITAAAAAIITHLVHAYGK